MGAAPGRLPVARMATEPTPAARVRAWVEGVLAQASTRRSADRTRPFLANEDRLSELFPDEQRESVDLLVDLLAEPLASLARRARPPRPPAPTPRPSTDWCSDCSMPI